MTGPALKSASRSFGRSVSKDLSKWSLLIVVFRKITTSEESAEDRAPSSATPGRTPDHADLARTAAPEAGPGTSAGAGNAGGRPGRCRGCKCVDLTDPKAIRALADPLRWGLLEALSHAGTLTATQASEMLGESPANCAFDLRTLAKYGFVEEAGGGRGRERPWRRRYDTLSWGRSQEDPGVMLAAEALDQVWMERPPTRARRSLTSTALWPPALGDTLGTSSSMLYVTPAEARRLYDEISAAFSRLSADRALIDRRNPERRPADAVPVEFVLLGYPVLDSPLLPDPGDAEASDADAGDGADAGGATAGGATAGEAPGSGSRDPENVRPPRDNGRAG